MEILSNSLARFLPVSTATDVAVSLPGDSVVPQTKCSQFFPYFLCIHESHIHRENEIILIMKVLHSLGSGLVIQSQNEFS